ncbi:MAG: AMP-dependent synthetase, partial [Deltaproteobacteria bacterium]|nr:AMP-dependent synthetase [Deltaproteobacteria bacterium]
MYTLGDIPRASAIIWPDHPAVVFEGKRYTYKQFNERINRFANYLIQSGYKKGDGVAVMAENCARYLEVYF